MLPLHMINYYICTIISFFGTKYGNVSITVQYGKKYERNHNSISKRHITKQNNSERGFSLFIYFKCLFCYLKVNSTIMIDFFSSIDVTKKEDKKNLKVEEWLRKISNPKHDNFPRRRYCDFLKFGNTG